MRVLMTGGGTAGHINPALAIADDLKRRHPDAEFLFVGAEGRMETELVPKAGYPIRTVRVKGFQRRLTPAALAHNVSAAFCALTAGRTCEKILKEFRPDIAIGTGGYVSGPILRKAAQDGIPVIVHESNALPGVTVKMLAKYATVCLPDESARAYLPEGSRAVVTGNPLRKEFAALDRTEARRALGLDARPMVLSFGGSLGAARLNEAMLYVLKESRAHGGIQHIHATGKQGYTAFCEAMQAQGVPLQGDGISVRAYIDDMSRCMAAADLVICRCGAMTLSELPICGKPSILIPSPYVAENHQYHNAMVLVERGAAVCIEEKDLTGEHLWETLLSLVSSPETLQRMSENARKGAITDASNRIYAVIRQALEEHGVL